MRRAVESPPTGTASGLAAKRMDAVRGKRLEAEVKARRAVAKGVSGVKKAVNTLEVRPVRE